MTEIDEVAQSIFDKHRAELPVLRDGLFQFVYGQMPEEVVNVMDAVTDAIIGLEDTEHGKDSRFPTNAKVRDRQRLRCAEESLVAEWVDGVGYCYMARATEPCKKQFDGMKPLRPTSMEDFGFIIKEREFQTDFILDRPSVATYNDGKPRQWQDSYNTLFSLPRVKYEPPELPTQEED